MYLNVLPCENYYIIQSITNQFLKTKKVSSVFYNYKRFIKMFLVLLIQKFSFQSNQFIESQTQCITHSTPFETNSKGFTSKNFNHRSSKLAQFFQLKTFETGEKELSRMDATISSKKKTVMLIDAGLAFNTPYPLLLRPERRCDVIISFDFSWRDEHDMMPFEVCLFVIVKVDESRLKMKFITKVLF